MDVLEDGVEPSPRGARASVIVVAVVVGLILGALVGRAWQQRDADAAADGTARLSAVLVFARVQLDPVNAGEDVKLYGELINTGPRAIGIAPGRSPRALDLGAAALGSGAATTFTAEEPLVCEGASVGEAPLLRVQATTPDGTTTEVALPLAGEAWEFLRLQCLPRSL